MIMNKLFQLGTAGILSFSLSTTAIAQGNISSEDAIEYRHSIMEVIVWNFKPMVAMVKGKIPFDAQVFANRAANVAFLSQMPLEGFIPGSDKGDTEAKPEIWTNWDDFKAKMIEFQEESAKLAEVAKTATTVKEITPQFAKTGEACKGCHKKYKED